MPLQFLTLYLKWKEFAMQDHVKEALEVLNKLFLDKESEWCFLIASLLAKNRNGILWKIN